MTGGSIFLYRRVHREGINPFTKSIMCSDTKHKCQSILLSNRYGVVFEAYKIDGPYVQNKVDVIDT